MPGVAGGGGRPAWWQRAPTPLAGRYAPWLDEWSVTGRAVGGGHRASGRLPMAGEASAVGAARGPRPWPAAARGCSAFLGATHGNLRSLLRQGQASLRSVLRSLDTRSLRLGCAA
jgi:hypothetical protein